MKRIDLTGKQFGDLTVIRLSTPDERNHRKWECLCSCGRTTYVHGYSLRHSHYKSCGCNRNAKRDDGLHDHISSDQDSGTRKSALQSKLHKGNKSGHKGVVWMDSRKKWKAYIGYRGKQINLGYFDNIDDAISARKTGEETYHKPHLESDDNGQK